MKKESPIERILEYRKSHPDHELKRLQAVKGSIKIKEALKASYKANKLKAIKNRMLHKHLQKSEDHCSAKIFDIRDPKGVRHRFRNLTHFIRENPHLFNADEIIWIDGHNRRGSFSMCRAIKGISGLNRKDRPVGHWHGWTKVSEEEKFFNNGKDLLDRIEVELR